MLQIVLLEQLFCVKQERVRQQSANSQTGKNKQQRRAAAAAAAAAMRDSRDTNARSTLTDACIAIERAKSA